MSPTTATRKFVSLSLIGALVLVGLFLLAVHPVQAEPISTMTVTTAADETTDWDNLCSLREAILSANNDDAGHSGCDDGDTDDFIFFEINAPIVLGSDLPTIQGPLIIDGEHLVAGETVSQTIDGNGHRIFALDQGFTLTLNSLILQDGSADYGGAVYNNNGTLTVTNSELKNNTASEDGGAIYHGNGALTVIDSIFSHNQSSQSAGGIFTNHGSATVLGSKFDHNSAGNSDNGGAINNYFANLVIEESTFKENSANYGGAIFTSQGPVTVTKSTFLTNTADIYGGAISLYTSSGTVAILKADRDTFVANQAEYGGAIYNQGGNAVFITNSTFYTNTGTTSGGAIFHSSYGFMTITHSTLYNNGNSNSITFWINLVMRNSIIATSYGENCSGFEAISGANNLQYGGMSDTCDTFEVGDPKLGALGDHGGPTFTILPAPGSPAIDRIPVAGGCGVGVTWDQRGVSRPIGTMCDIGAVESYLFNFLPLIIH